MLLAASHFALPVLKFGSFLLFIAAYVAVLYGLHPHRRKGQGRQWVIRSRAVGREIRFLSSLLATC